MVDETGLVMPVAVGTVEISAVLGEFSGSTTLEVTDAALESISIDSETGVLATPVGVELSLSALGTFSDGISQDITAAAVWDSLDKNVATVDANGLVTPVSAGSTFIVLHTDHGPITQTINVLAE